MRLNSVAAVQNYSEDVPRLAWRIEEIAKETGLSTQFLRKEIKRNNLKAKKRGRCVLVLNSDLQKYLNEGEDNEK